MESIPRIHKIDSFCGRFVTEEAGVDRLDIGQTRPVQLRTKALKHRGRYVHRDDTAAQLRSS